jgi:putative MATE family efflux protein
MPRANDHILANPNLGKLLTELSVPAIIGMFIMSTFNVVDTIFVGHGVGMLGIAGVAVVFPVNVIVLAIGQLIGMGSASIISRAIGSKDIAKANRALGNMLSMIIFLSIIITVFGQIFIDDLLRLMGATPDILPFAHAYLRIVLFDTLFRCILISSNNVIRSEGRAKVSMALLIITAVINTILDPIFIFWLDMGVKGAAIATLISQGLGAIYAFYFYFSKKTVLTPKLADFVPDFRIIRETFGVGMASLARNVSSSVLVVIMNYKLAHHGGDVAIAVLGVVHRLTFLAFTPLIGIAQGFQPIAGYNYGARKYSNVRKLIEISTKRSTIIGIITCAVLIAFPGIFIRLFTRDEELIRMAIPALRISAITLPIIGAQTVWAIMFQALGHSWRAFILTASRQLIFLIPLVLILPAHFGWLGVFYSMPIADVLATAVTLVFLIAALKAFPEDAPV